MNKELGKIESLKMGFTGYQDCSFGLHVILTTTGGCVQDMICGDYVKTCDRIVQLMEAAKVSDVQHLKNVPVEVTFDNARLVEWRILTEVL